MRSTNTAIDSAESAISSHITHSAPNMANEVNSLISDRCSMATPSKRGRDLRWGLLAKNRASVPGQLRGYLRRVDGACVAEPQNPGDAPANLFLFPRH